MDRELRDWLRGLAQPSARPGALDHPTKLSQQGSDYLALVATDGTLKAALAELAANELDLAG